MDGNTPPKPNANRHRHRAINVAVGVVWAPLIAVVVMLGTLFCGVSLGLAFGVGPDFAGGGEVYVVLGTGAMAAIGVVIAALMRWNGIRKRWQRFVLYTFAMPAMFLGLRYVLAAYRSFL